MLLRPDGDAVIAITQPAHAWVSGQLARAWGNERFGAVEPWEEVCLAAEQHDVGMTDWELAPTLNPETGLPHSFMEMDLETHIGLWSARPIASLPQSRYAALLVSLHGTALYERRDLARLAPADAERVRAFLAGQRELQERLQPPGRHGRRGRAATSGWCGPGTRSRSACCWTGGRTSCGRCRPRTSPVDIAVRGDADVVTLDPWPFSAERVRVRAEARRLAGRYDDEAAMRSALAHAPWSPSRSSWRRQAGAKRTPSADPDPRRSAMPTRS